MTNSDAALRRNFQVRPRHASMAAQALTRPAHWLSVRSSGNVDVSPQVTRSNQPDVPDTRFER